MYHPDESVLPRKIDKVLFLNSSDYIARNCTNAIRLPNSSLALAHYLLGKFPKTEIKVIDLETKDFRYDLVRGLKEFLPDLVCSSINATSLWPSAKKILSLIKTAVSPIIIVGGVHPTADPLRVLQEAPEIDILCWGLDGEVVLEEIFKVLTRGGYLSEIGKDQVYFRNGLKKGGQIVKSFGTQRLVTDLTKLKLNDVRRFVNLNDYNLVVEGWEGKAYSTWCSRGCPFACFYCLESGWRGGLTQKTTDQQIEEVLFAKENYFSEDELVQIYYVEDMGTGTTFHLKEFCQRVIDTKKKDVSLKRRLFFRCQTRVELLMGDPEIIPLMAKAGFSDVYLGIEDANEDVLQACNKTIDIKLAEKAVKALQTNGIRVRLLMIVGLPYQTERHMERTLAWLKKVRGNRVQASPFRPYPGTVFGDNPSKFGIEILNRDYSCWDIFSGKDQSGVWQQTQPLRMIYRTIWLKDPQFIYRMAERYEAVPKTYPPLKMGRLVYDTRKFKKG